jgi:hypothetical protein
VSTGPIEQKRGQIRHANTARLERLSILFATGDMPNARRIVVSNEPENERNHDSSNNAFSKLLDRFLHAGAAENWA